MARALLLLLCLAAGMAPAADARGLRGHTSNQMMFLVIQGDSITECDGVSTQNCYVTVVSQYASSVRGIAMPPSVSSADAGAGFFNLSVNGLTCTSMGSWADGYVNQPNARLVIFCGTNDISNSHTAQQTYAGFLTWLNARIAAGWKVGNIVAMQALPRGVPLSSSAFEALRQPYNQLLAAGAAAYGYQLVPLGDDTVIGQPGQWANLTYYKDDEIHPVDAGHAIIAADIVGLSASCPTCPGVR
jgi:hypothetical protein